MDCALDRFGCPRDDILLCPALFSGKNLTCERWETLNWIECINKSNVHNDRIANKLSFVFGFYFLNPSPAMAEGAGIPPSQRWGFPLHGSVMATSNHSLHVHRSNVIRLRYTFRSGIEMRFEK